MTISLFQCSLCFILLREAYGHILGAEWEKEWLDAAATWNAASKALPAEETWVKVAQQLLAGAKAKHTSALSSADRFEVAADAAKEKGQSAVAELRGKAVEAWDAAAKAWKEAEKCVDESHGICRDWWEGRKQVIAAARAIAAAAKDTAEAAAVSGSQPLRRAWLEAVKPWENAAEGVRQGKKQFAQEINADNVQNAKKRTNAYRRIIGAKRQDVIKDHITGEFEEDEAFPNKINEADLDENVDDGQEPSVRAEYLARKKRKILRQWTSTFAPMSTDPNYTAFSLKKDPFPTIIPEWALPKGPTPKNHSFKIRPEVELQEQVKESFWKSAPRWVQKFEVGSTVQVVGLPYIFGGARLNGRKGKIITIPKDAEIANPNVRVGGGMMDACFKVKFSDGTDKVLTAVNLALCADTPKAYRWVSIARAQHLHVFTFEEGLEVEVMGLQSNTTQKYNGQIGKLVSENPSGRFVVELEDGSQKAFRPENLAVESSVSEIATDDAVGPERPPLKVAGGKFWRGCAVETHGLDKNGGQNYFYQKYWGLIGTVLFEQPDGRVVVWFASKNKQAGMIDGEEGSEASFKPENLKIPDGLPWDGQLLDMSNTGAKVPKHRLEQGWTPWGGGESMRWQKSWLQESYQVGGDRLAKKDPKVVWPLVDAIALVALIGSSRATYVVLGFHCGAHNVQEEPLLAN